MHLSDSHTFVLLLKTIEVFANELVKPFPWLLATCLLYFVEIDHSILEVDDLKVGVRKVHLVEIPHDIRYGARTVEFTREFVEYQAHPCNILY